MEVEASLGQTHDVEPGLAFIEDELSVCMVKGLSVLRGGDELAEWAEGFRRDGDGL